MRLTYLLDIISKYMHLESIYEKEYKNKTEYRVECGLLKYPLCIQILVFTVELLYIIWLKITHICIYICLFGIG